MFQDFSLTALTKTEREKKKSKQIVMAFFFSMEMIYSAEYILNPVAQTTFAMPNQCKVFAANQTVCLIYLVALQASAILKVFTTFLQRKPD